MASEKETTKTKKTTPKKTTTTKKTTTKKEATKKTTTTKKVAEKKTTPKKTTKTPTKKVTKETTTSKNKKAVVKKETVPVQAKKEEKKVELVETVTPQKDNRVLLIVLIILSVLIIAIASILPSMLKDRDYGSGNENQTQENESGIPVEEQGGLTTITIDEYIEKKDAEAKSIIYVARPTCYFCQQEEPLVRNIVYLYDAEVNYLNTDTLDEAGFEKLTNSDEYFQGKWGTPILMIVENGEIVDKLEGLHSKEEIIEFFQKYEMIGEPVK